MRPTWGKKEDKRIDADRPSGKCAEEGLRQKRVQYYTKEKLSAFKVF